MPLADYHDMVKAFPPNRANHPLRIGVLPWRAWRNDRLPDVQQPRLTRKSFAIDLIPVPDQMPRALVLPARLDQLSCRPPGTSGTFVTPLRRSEHRCSAGPVRR